MSRYTTEAMAMEIWDRAHAGTGCRAESVERNQALRGWHVRCSCGNQGDVCDGLAETGLWADKESHMDARILDAFDQMSNVMRCVDQALTCKAFVKLDEHISRGFLQSLYLRFEKSMGEMVSTLSSEEWSRRVREGVKALPKPGPVVTCQSEED